MNIFFGCLGLLVASTMAAMEVWYYIRTRRKRTNVGINASRRSPLHTPVTQEGYREISNDEKGAGTTVDEVTRPSNDQDPGDIRGRINSSHIWAIFMVLVGLVPAMVVGLEGFQVAGSSPITPASVLFASTHFLAWMLVGSIWWLRRGSFFCLRLRTLFLSYWPAIGLFQLFWGLKFSQHDTLTFWAGACALTPLYLGLLALHAFQNLRVSRTELDHGYHALPGAEDHQIHLLSQASRNIEPGRNSTCTSQLFFWWMQPLLALGRKRQLNQEDLPKLDPHVKINASLEEFKRNWEEAKAEESEARESSDIPLGARLVKRRFVWALWRSTRWYFLYGMLLGTLSSACLLLQPFLLQHFIAYLGGERIGWLGGSASSSNSEGYVLASALALLTVIQTLFDNHNWKVKLREGMRARGICISFIYEKLMRISVSGKAKLTDGKIINIVSTDCNRIEWVYYWSDCLWTASIQFIGTLIFLYFLLDWPALCGVAVILIILPVQVYLGQYVTRLTREQMAFTDERMDYSREMILAMRVVKFYVWEQYFNDKILEAREREMRKIASQSYVQAFITFLGTTMPATMSLAAFAVYASLYDGPLSPAQAITSLSLFNNLKGPLYTIPQAVQALAGAIVAVDRVTTLLEADEVDPLPILDQRAQQSRAEEYESEIREGKDGDNENRKNFTRNIDEGNGLIRAMKGMSEAKEGDCKQIDIERCPSADASRIAKGQIWVEHKNFYFDKFDGDTPAIENLKLVINPGSLTMVVGAFGSGKSFLLTSLLGEIYHAEASSRDKGCADITKNETSSQKNWNNIRSGDESKWHAGDASNPLLAFDQRVSGVDSGQGKRCSNSRRARASFFRPGSKVAYVPQSAWILNDTIRNNVLFGKAYDEVRYRETIIACALTADLEALEAGDATEVGERGITLSGGQRQRVSIARAVYCRDDCDLFLFDDPFSALDAHVGQWVFDRVFTRLLRGKTRVLVTHQLQYLPMATHVIVMKSNTETLQRNNDSEEEKEIGVKNMGGDIHQSHKGDFGSSLNRPIDVKVDTVEEGNIRDVRLEIIEQGTYRQLVYETKRKKGVLWSMMKDYAIANEADGGDNKKYSISQGDQQQGQTEPNSSTLNVPIKLRRQSSEQARKAWRRIRTKSEAKGAYEGRLVEEEHREVGAVSARVYKSYMQQVGIWWWILLTVFISSVLGCYRLSDLWLSRWSSDEANDQHPASYYLMGYAIISLATLILTLATTFTSAGLSIRSAISVHDKLIRSLLRAKMAFYDTTPTGRIANRLSRDQDTIDQQLTSNFYFTLRAIAQVLSMVIVICVVIVYFGLALIPVMLVFYSIMQYYRHSSRELQRLDSTTKSPIFAHLSATLGGLVSIRGFGASQRFTARMINHTENNMRAFWMATVVNLWLSTQLGLLSAACLLLISLLSVVLSIDAGLAGLCITYGFAFVFWIQALIKAFSRLEMNMNAVERTDEYIHLPREGREQSREKHGQHQSNQPNCQEQCEEIGFSHVPQGWPRTGNIDIQGTSLRYRAGLPLVLKELKLHFTPGTKVGICGRTGAGKSSLMAMFFRLAEPEGGSCLIDGIDITKIPLHTLRHAIGVIPQDPTIFSGTIRANLDPYEQHSEQDISRALSVVQMEDYVKQIGGLSHVLDAGSGSMSLGQRQLLCVARALLKKPKVLILDEATASIDYKTDKLIQETIMDHFQGVTVLTIAHRIETIRMYDQILVLEEGRVAEFGPPSELINKGGLFAGLVAESASAKPLSPLG